MVSADPTRAENQVSADTWCARIPELQRAGPHLWKGRVVSEVSFPNGGHPDLVEIEEASYWFAHRNRVLSAVVANHPPSGLVFDIGGGNGFVAAGLCQAGFPALVIEPGREGVAVALRRGLPAVQAAFQDLTIPADSIPAAGLFDVLEHIEDDVAALAELHRTLAPGGMLYVAVPAHQALWSSEDVRAGHFRRYGLSALTRRVREAGFEVVFGSYFFSWLVLPVFLLRAVPDRFRIYGEMSVERTATDHSLPDNMIGRAVHRSFVRELELIEANRPVRFGASCVVACRKPSR